MSCGLLVFWFAVTGALVAIAWSTYTATVWIERWWRTRRVRREFQTQYVVWRRKQLDAIARISWKIE